MLEPKDDTTKDLGAILEIPVTKTKKNIGWETLPHGCKLWEVNLADLTDIQPASYKSSAIDGRQIHHQVIIKPGYFYAMAINKKNALRKFWKVNPGFRKASHQPPKDPV